MFITDPLGWFLFEEAFHDTCQNKPSEINRIVKKDSNLNDSPLYLWDLVSNLQRYELNFGIKNFDDIILKSYIMTEGSFFHPMPVGVQGTDFALTTEVQDQHMIAIVTEIGLLNIANVLNAIRRLTVYKRSSGYGGDDDFLTSL